MDIVGNSLVCILYGILELDVPTYLVLVIVLHLRMRRNKEGLQMALLQQFFAWGLHWFTIIYWTKTFSFLKLESLLCLHIPFLLKFQGMHCSMFTHSSKNSFFQNWLQRMLYILFPLITDQMNLIFFHKCNLQCTWGFSLCK